jgi:G protein-coupled receptor 158
LVLSTGVLQCELKRLYTQLQIYKTKTMRQDNPHISKRRGGRKQTHRRFSLQAFHSKHKYGGHHSSSGGPGGDRSSAGGDGGGGGHGGGACGEHSVIGGETEVSRSPEDSVNSQEGVSVYADESSVAEIRSPTVTFKPGHRSKHAS